MELQRGKKILDPFMHNPKVNKGIDVCDLQNKKLSISSIVSIETLCDIKIIHQLILF
jgi:hypothetical protein